jgi:HlyD family secretion protein
MRHKLLWALIILILGTSAVGGYWYYTGPEPPPQYLTARVEQGRLEAVVNATGTVNAVVTVQVGSQVTGTIQKLLVDFNSAVTEGQIIAQIDPASFEARVSQVRANLASAKAAVQVAQATVENTRAAIETAQANAKSAQANIDKARVALVDTERTLERQKGLLRRSLVSQSEVDAAQTAFDGALSQLKLSEAQYEASLGQLKSARAQGRLTEAQYTSAVAQVEQAQAALQAAELDLAHTTIRSPVHGTVISRNVDVGQTVAASLQAPILFMIAQDLSQMQVDTNVSEADIGRVYEGQVTTFTVDAYPERNFTGQVVQVRNAPINVQNVVTYNAVVKVDNTDLTLRPGMTANVVFIVARREAAMKIPNAALRFQPLGGSASTSAQNGSTPGGGDRLPAIQQRLTQALALSSEQQARLEDIMQRARQQGMRLREPGLSEEEQRARRRELQGQTRAQIRSMLTDSQRQQYEEMLKTADRQRQDSSGQERPGRVWILGSDGQPQPVGLKLGISDNAFTEVVAGELRVGQEILTGMQTATKRPGTPATPPGFGQRPF